MGWFIRSFIGVCYVLTNLCDLINKSHDRVEGYDALFASNGYFGIHPKCPNYIIMVDWWLLFCNHILLHLNTTIEYNPWSRHYLSRKGLCSLPRRL